MTIENRILVRESIDELGNRINELSQIFYRELLHLDISLKRIFSGNVVFLNRKFSNMLATIKNLKHLEKIQHTIEKLAERHLLSYGAQIEHLELVRTGLITALKEVLEDRFTEQVEAAWHSTLSELMAVMQQAMASADRRKQKREGYQDDAYDPELLERIGGYDRVYQVHQRFYDVMFDHPWLGRFFGGKDKQTLIRKQTDFMVAAFGGPNNYSGDTPAFIHMHMYITDEQADLRESILRQAIIDDGIDDETADKWLSMDHSFRESIVKKSMNECVMKCRGQAPLVADKPETGKAKKTA